MAQKYLYRLITGSFNFVDDVRKEVSGLLSLTPTGGKAMGGSGPAVSRKAAAKKPLKKYSADDLEEAPLLTALCAYAAYTFLFLVGTLREWMYGIGPLDENQTEFNEKDREGYAPLFSQFETFYIRNVIRRTFCILFRPIASCPGGTVEVRERKTKDFFWSSKIDGDGETTKCVNLASYNYLGYAENSGPISETTVTTTKEDGLTISSPRNELGNMQIHQELEDTIAKFLGTEDALAVGMGFATNSMNLPSLLGKGTLVLSDEKNHASLILGLRLSGATTKVFKHNNIENLEFVLRKSIINGHPRTRRAWSKIVIVVEGVYSMEGTIVDLPAVVALKKKYGAYIYLDEAHSVGAMGPQGRGVVNYYGLNPKDIDIMMGTFTKSFGAAGGYIAGSKKLIDYLRVNSQTYAYPTSFSPPVARQVISSMNEIMHGDGLKRIETLARNSKYFRQKLQQMGSVVYGHDDSPVVPMLTFHPVKVYTFVLALHNRGVATVGVGFPALTMTEERVRFCVSASHTKEMLDEALHVIQEEAAANNLPISRRPITRTTVVY